MKLLTAAIVVGPLMLASIMPALSQIRRNPDQSGLVQLAAADPAERNTYMQTARAEMLVWKQKLQEFGERTQAKTTEAQTKASSELNEAWTETKTASARLETAAAEDWESAKTSFKSASDKLAIAWQNIGAKKK
ncbi:MAG: hypothetical protein ABJA75_21355 [Bradyrhizobium sp.]